MPTTRANKQSLEREQYTTGAPGTPGVQQTLTFPPIIHLVRSQAHLSTQACLRISVGRCCPGLTYKTHSLTYMSAFTRITKPFRFLIQNYLPKTELGFREII